MAHVNEGLIKNNRQYQGIYSEFDEYLGWNDFDLRNYDPQIGRWIQQDPYDQYSSPYIGMGNDWVNGKDKNGAWFGTDDAVVLGVGFLINYVSYGITKGNWGGKALLSGLAGAAIAEVSYLTLGGGAASSTLANVGGNGSSAGALSFSANYAFSNIQSMIKNRDQIKQSNDWASVGLISGYSLFSAIQAGYNSKYREQKIDKLLNYDFDKEYDANHNATDNTGAVSNMLGGIISSAGKSILRGYDPKTNRWNLDGGKIFLQSLLLGGGNALVGRQASNLFSEGDGTHNMVGMFWDAAFQWTYIHVLQHYKVIEGEEINSNFINNLIYTY